MRMKQPDLQPNLAAQVKRQLVLGSRILANEGLLDCFGHISVRNPGNPNTFFQSRSLSAEQITLEDILELNLRGEVVSGPAGARPFWEAPLHARILAARPEVNSVFHGHPASVIPFTVLPDIPLLPVSICGGVFYNGYGYYSAPPDSDMTVKTLEEGDQLAQALGDRWAVLMQGHGIAVAAGSVPELVFDVAALVKNAEIYLDCLRIGAAPPLCCSPEAGAAYRASHHREGALRRVWEYYVRRAEAAMPDLVR